MWRFYDSSGRVKQNTKPTISLVTSLPSSPTDGDECILTDSLTAGTYHWHLRYVSARSSNKWVFVGGSPAIVQVGVGTEESTASTALTDLTTDGPSFTIPVAGNYHFQGEVSTGRASVDGAYRFANICYDGSAVYDAISSGAGDARLPIMSSYTKTGAAATKVVKLRYASQGGGATTYFNTRTLKVTPIALGG